MSFVHIILTLGKQNRTHQAGIKLVNLILNLQIKFDFVLRIGKIHNPVKFTTGYYHHSSVVFAGDFCSRFYLGFI